MCPAAKPAKPPRWQRLKALRPSAATYDPNKADDPNGPEDPNDPQFAVLTWNEVLGAERKALGLKDAKSGDPRDRAYALCLSGGGIRSAAFCLGAISPLLQRGLMKEFHYLSTVSGGGYVGAWLTRAIAAAKPDSKKPWLPTDLLARDGRLANLRRYSNFLTPTPGIASLDSWAGATLVLRNMLINWMLLLPLLLGVAATATVLLLLRIWLAGVPYLSRYLAAAGLVCLIFAIRQSILALPSHAETPSKPRRVLVQMVAPSLAWAILAALADLSRPENQSLPSWVLPLASVGGGATAYCLAWHQVSQRYQNVDEHLWLFGRNFIAWIFSCVCSGLLLWLGLVLSSRIEPLWWTVLGPPWLVAAEALRSTIYVALRRDGLKTALDREWLGRLNGDKLRMALAYLVLTAATLGLPMLILKSPLGVWSGLVAAVTFLSSGPAAALLGKSARTAFAIIEPSAPDGASKPALSLRLLLPALSLVFILTLLVLLGVLAAYLTAFLGSRFASNPSPFPKLLAALVILLACVILVGWVGAVVKVNRFSLHAVYANRLVRAFLGTARPRDRDPDPYTDFDPRDNARVSDMFDQKRHPGRRALFPVINATLNATRSRDTARAERKAVPFTITPLHCGSRFLRTHGNEADVQPSGAYVPTAHYAGGEGRETGPDDKRRGLSLGTAMTISGAALSPNMGYNSSSLTAFVMTLFNVRLGAWMPNPGMAEPDKKAKPDASVQEPIGTTKLKTMHRSSPGHALWPMLQELFGITQTTSRYVYLSDGGHFDNLGLYEMLQRRCKLIVAIDAGQDHNYDYTDLGHALQHVLIDAGVTVEFIQSITIRAKALGDYGAYAEINYPEITCPETEVSLLPKETGQLLYIKPWLPPNAPTELQAFRALKQNFPHASTADQFFTESDFESYRRLGEYLMAETLKITGAETGELQLDVLFKALAKKAKPAIWT